MTPTPAMKRSPICFMAFLAQTLADIYPEKDYHKMFIGEIVKVLGREPTKS
jgi:hypothetical protein